MKNNIAIDIDSTICNTEDEILDFIGLFYNTYYDKKDITETTLDKSLKGVDKDVIRDAIDLAVSNPKLKFYTDAERVIKWISEFYNIYFITYRDFGFFDQTMELLNRLNINFQLIFSKRRLGKHSIIQQKNIKVLIEDDADTINDVSDKTNCDIIIYDQPWNRMIKQNSNRIRIFNWNEIKSYFIIKGK